GLADDVLVQLVDDFLGSHGRHGGGCREPGGRGILEAPDTGRSSTAFRRRLADWCRCTGRRRSKGPCERRPPRRVGYFRGARALGFTTAWPRRIWQSPPNATFPSRRADMMVVPWNCSMSEFREDGAEAPAIKLFARNNTCNPVQADDAEQGADPLIRAANLNR